MQQRKAFVLGISIGCLVIGGLAWLFWLFLTQAFVSSEMNGPSAIAQTRYATDASLEETQAAVSNANFLVLRGGIDATAFYQFQATDAYMQDFINRTKLKETPNDLLQCKSFLTPNIWRSWWNPNNYPTARCYTGSYDGAFYYLLYDAEQNIAFLKIQDT